MKKRIQNLTFKGLYNLAKDLKIEKYTTYTAKTRGDLEKKVLAVKGIEDVDLSKYPTFQPKEEAKADSKATGKGSEKSAPKTKRVPSTPRRTRYSSRGRR